MKTQSLKELVAQATPLPWLVIVETERRNEDYPHPLGLRPQRRVFIGRTGLTVAEIPPGLKSDDANAALLAHSPAALVRCVEALEEVPDLLDALAGDAEESGFDVRASNARRAANELRSALAVANNVPVP